MKKTDEMDVRIRLQSQSLSFKVALLLLSIWTVYEVYSDFVEKRAVNSVPGYILIAVVVFEGICEQILKYRMIQGDEEYREPNKVFLIIFTIIVGTAFILSVGSILLLR